MSQKSPRFVTKDSDNLSVRVLRQVCDLRSKCRSTWPIDGPSTRYIVIVGGGWISKASVLEDWKQQSITYMTARAPLPPYLRRYD